jgi:hypothetical protein
VPDEAQLMLRAQSKAIFIAQKGNLRFDEGAPSGR